MIDFWVSRTIDHYLMIRCNVYLLVFLLQSTENSELFQLNGFSEITRNIYSFVSGHDWTYLFHTCSPLINDETGEQSNAVEHTKWSEFPSTTYKVYYLCFKINFCCNIHILKMDRFIFENKHIYQLFCLLSLSQNVVIRLTADCTINISNDID